MSLSLAALRHLVEFGLSAEQILAVAEAQGEETKTAARSPAAERQARYRSLRGISETEWTAIRRRVIKRDGLVCSYCKNLASPPHVDHVVPVSKGGANDDDNLCVACGPCNSAKRDKSLREWRAGR